LSNFVYQPIVKQQTVDGDTVHLVLEMPENLFYFQGHFPQAAVLPGVAQLDWVMGYLSEFFGMRKDKLLSVDALKFQIIVRPSYIVDLTLTKLKCDKFGFSYSSTHGQHASGKVVFSE